MFDPQIELQKPEVQEWLAKASSLIQMGIVPKAEHPEMPILMYKCGTVLRIDIKNVFKV